MTQNDKKIAIVGMSCRLPGKIHTPNDYWNVLSQGLDVVTEVSNERWATDFHSHPDKNEPGKTYTFAAGVLDNIDEFDASFFNISPREANQMDPQQRLLLELSWEAIEDSSMTAQTLKETDCAVYVGIASNDYAHRHSDDLASFDAYTMTGSTASVASNRISYAFDLRGPSVSVDTACSSSLVAVHQACQAILSGDASTALCGGINMLIHPFPFVGFSKASMLSPEGRCRAFDDSGNGYVRSEGAGMLLLKPLSQAEKDGDTIHGIIAGSGINSDGATSGITVPGMETQSALLEKVYKESGISADEISYLEAHGTGTSVGDPLEATALGKTIGKHRSKQNPLLIGSAKTNLGHLETASGMAGILKAILTLQNKTIPASLHFNTPNKNIDFDDLNLSVVTQNTPLPNRTSSHYVGINSFGFGGANAHVLLEEYKTQHPISPEPCIEAVPPLLIYAKSAEALSSLASSYANLISTNESNYYNLAYSALFKQSELSHALAVDSQSPAEIAEELSKFADSGNSSHVVAGRHIDGAKVAFVFTGNGCQWQGMGQALYTNNSRFRQIFERVSIELTQLSSEYSLVTELFKDEFDSNLNRTEIAQPLLFAIQVGIVDYLNSYGIKPSAVLGHSVGEVAAAWASGSLSLNQAVMVIHHRSQAQGLTRGQGRMAAVGLGGEDLTLLLDSIVTSTPIEVAGENSPNAATVAGDLQSLQILGKTLNEADKFYRLLDLDYAFHSRHMDPIEDRVISSLTDLNPKKNDILFVSTVTGEPLDGSELNAAYWWENIRQPVQFGKAVTHLIEQGTNIFIEISPHSILRGYINDCLRSKSADGFIIETSKRKTDEVLNLKQAALKAFTAGCLTKPSELFPYKGKHVSLPNYPWQKTPYWYQTTTEAYDLSKREREHPLLGYRLKDSNIIWENNLDTTEYPFLADHVVDDAIVLPAAGYIEMALAASHLWGATDTHHIEMVEIPTPILLEPNKSKKVQFHLDTEDGSFYISSRDRLSTDEWTQNATGRLLGHSFKKGAEKLNTDDFSPSQNSTGLEHYTLASKVGLDYGPNFQAVTAVKSNENSAIATLKLPPELEPNLDTYHLHPSLLDSGFQVLVDICKSAINSGQRKALIPIQIGSLHLLKGSANEATTIQVHIIKQSPRSVVANFGLFDNSGNLIALLERCRFRQVQFKKALAVTVNQYHHVLQPLPLLEEWPETPTMNLNGLLDSLTSSCKKTSKDEEYSLLIDIMITNYTYKAISGLANTTNFNIEELKERTAEEHHSLLLNLLNTLQDNDLVEISEDSVYQLLPADELPEPEAIWQYIIQGSPNYLPSLMLISQVGEQLESLLSGNKSSEEILSPKKSSLIQQLIETGPSYGEFNDKLKTFVHQTIELFPKNQLCRVLLVTNYPEQMSAHLLSTLQENRYHLVIASEDEAKLGAVERTFENVETISTIAIGINKINKASFSQPFDLVICQHSLHQIDDLTTGLQGLRSVLNTNGCLIALERSADKFTDFTFGTKPNWWSGDQSRLLAPQAWSSSLESCGFNQVSSLTEHDNLSHQGVYLLCAINPAAYDISPEIDYSQNVDQEKWLLVNGSDNGHLEPLSDALLKSKKVAETVLLNETCSDKQLPQLLTENSFDHIVFISTTEAASLSKPIMTLQNLLTVTENLESKPHLTLVTCGAVTAEGVSLNFNPKNSPLWGFGRVVMNEYPELACKLVDVQIELASAAIRSLSCELLYGDKNNEVVLTQESRHVLRMTPCNHNASKTIHTNEPAALDFKTPGSFKNLYWKALPTVQLSSDQIEIQPAASGLNFRDVMYAMGLLSDEAVENGFAGPTLGMEVAGVVTRIGHDVTDFAVGDEVLGFAPACFSNRVITETTATAHKPSSWSFEEAATIPAAFFTVYYAFVELARVQEGEKVLIHGASGGVGIAAVQLALHLGLEVFATAGTDEKRSFVKKIGAHHVMDSRSLSFEAEVMELTEGKGIDVVLNSISGEAINRNLSVLKPFGRFLELGKRDFYENSRIGLRPFRNNITYFGIDADQLLIEKKTLARKLFAELMTLFENGELYPLPFRVFEASRIQSAFQYMQQSRQIGKIIISIPKSLPAEQFQATETLELSEESNYLITGGLSGFGLKTAQWLASKGAKHLTLLGRTGASSETAQAAISQLEKSGVTVYAPACDVSDKTQLADTLSEIEKNGFKITGVIHAATVFDDGLIRSLSEERMNSVLNSKALGAWNLHELTKDMSLEFFVLYSSATTLFGNPGQANYVAANYMLENLVSYRRKSGLKACYAAWGAISDVGFLARNSDTQESLLARLGGTALTSNQALLELESLILSENSGAAYINFDWKSIKRGMPAAKSLRFNKQNNELASRGDDDESEDFLSKIVGLTDEEVKTLITQLLAKEISQILRLPIDKIDQSCAIYDLGMDSLMGMELLMAIEERFGIKLPLMSLTEGGNIQKIADKIQMKLRDKSPSENDETVESLVSKHGATLSSAELERVKKATNE